MSTEFDDVFSSYSFKRPTEVPDWLIQYSVECKEVLKKAP